MNKSALTEKWDRIKLTCTQPFKRDVQFGLSFIKFYTTEAEDVLTTPSSLPPLVQPFVSSQSPTIVITEKSSNAKKSSIYNNNKINSDDNHILNKLHGRHYKNNSDSSGNSTPVVKRFHNISIRTPDGLNSKVAHTASNVKTSIDISNSNSEKNNCNEPEIQRDPIESSARQAFLQKLNKTAEKNKLLPSRYAHTWFQINYVLQTVYIRVSCIYRR